MHFLFWSINLSISAFLMENGVIAKQVISVTIQTYNGESIMKIQTVSTTLLNG